MPAKDPPFTRLVARLDQMSAKLADIDQKLRHIIQRLPDEFTAHSDASADPANADDSTHQYDSYIDSDDE